MKLILLNGPPRCGKDTAAQLLRNHYKPRYTTRWEKFSRPHKEAFAAMARENIDFEFNVAHYELRKAETIPWLGVSYRQWQIDFSEKFMKPLYGETIFARMLLERIRNRAGEAGYLCVVSDCGFQIEVDTVAAAWNPADLMVITVMRDGCTFAGDSRQYVKPTNNSESLWKIAYNNRSIDDFKTELLTLTKDFLP